jgi:hypothetical protein
MSNRWDSLVTGFCSTLFDGYPEVFNCVTSFAMLFVGCYLLYALNLKPFIIKAIASCFIVNWFGSFMVHYVGYLYYGHIDTFSMLMVSWFINYLVCSGIFAVIRRRLIREPCTDTWALFGIVFLIFTLAATAVSGKPWNVDFDFAAAFAVPNIISIVAMFALLGMTWRRITWRVVIYFIVGLSMMIIAVIIWLATEPKCLEIRGTGEKPNEFMRVSHGFWHLLFSFGAYYFIIIAIYVRYVIEDKDVIFMATIGCGCNCGCCRCCGCSCGFESLLGYILPVVDIKYENMGDLPI